MRITENMTREQMDYNLRQPTTRKLHERTTKDGKSIKADDTAEISAQAKQLHEQSTVIEDETADNLSADIYQSDSQKFSFSDTNDLSKYLFANYDIVKGGMTNISKTFMEDCLTDVDSMNRLFEILNAAEKSYAARKDEVGFQGMKVTIDENGEVTTQSTKSTVSINEEKRKRQISAAATKGDMQAVIALLEQDLQQVQDGLKRNMCDEAEVAKARKLLELAKQRMSNLPDRAPTQAEQTITAINTLM
ncbi:MAG: hypothetical protein K6G55_07065 [Selenomonadaceae bacterium]|nr:hypothetical protein [Selenomonadaceae bacterium]